MQIYLLLEMSQTEEVKLIVAFSTVSRDQLMSIRDIFTLNVRLWVQCLVWLGAGRGLCDQYEGTGTVPHCTDNNCTSITSM
jgi:hypothetical protein